MMFTVLLGTALLVTVAVAIGLLIDRKRPVLPAPEAPPPLPAPPPRLGLPRPGETAATAVRVPASWRERIAAGRCTCGKPLAVTSDEPITLAGRPLVVVRLDCAACGHHRSVYLEPAPA